MNAAQRRRARRAARREAGRGPVLLADGTPLLERYPPELGEEFD